MVRDSVTDIVNECDRLFEIADGLSERIDIYYVGKDLKKSESALKEAYAREVYEEDKIAALKKDCESDAIRFEYCLSRFSDKCRQRYKWRSEVATLFNTIKKKLKAYREAHEYENIGKLLVVYGSVRELMEDTLHICCIPSDEDRELLGLINKEVGGFE